MAGQPKESRRGDAAWYREAEELLCSLKGIMSARVVGRPGGAVEEVHILTTDEVSPKQTVRNVESALLARYDVTLDHRKISVAQTTARLPKAKPSTHGLKPAHEGVVGGGLPLRRPLVEEPARPAPPRAEAAVLPSGNWEKSTSAPRDTEAVAPERLAEADAAVAPAPTGSANKPPPPVSSVRPGPSSPVAVTNGASLAQSSSGRPEPRLLFLSHSAESLRSHRLNMKVTLQWLGKRYVGEAAGADVSRARLEGFALATLRAIEAALTPSLPEEQRDGLALSLDGVKLVEAFDRKFILVAVNAVLAGQMNQLTGAAAVDDSSDRAVVLAALQATDRRVRAVLQGIGPGGAKQSKREGGPDPFDVWA